jgi:hypothetical protein
MNELLNRAMCDSRLTGFGLTLLGPTLGFAGWTDTEGTQ